MGRALVSHRFDLREGAAAALFAAGRMAGWIAHALEQKRQGFLLRPTAEYVGD